MNNAFFKFKYDLVQLIYLADINYLSCKKIYSKVINNDKENAYSKFLLLSANNSFYEAVSILHTLLCSKKDEEVRIKPALQGIIESQRGLIPNENPNLLNKFVESIKADYPNPNFSKYDFLGLIEDRGDIMAQFRVIKTTEKGLADFDTIIKQFKEYDFHKIRHQVAAHKNKHLEDPAGAIHLILQDNLIKQLGEIIKDLKIHSYFWFGYSLESPDYLILNTLDKLIDEGYIEV